MFRFFGGWGSVSGFLGVPECFGMFRYSGVLCSGVPGSITCLLKTELYENDVVTIIM